MEKHGVNTNAVIRADGSTLIIAVSRVSPFSVSGRSSVCNPGSIAAPEDVSVISPTVCVCGGGGGGGM